MFNLLNSSSFTTKNLNNKNINDKTLGIEDIKEKNNNLIIKSIQIISKEFPNEKVDKKQEADNKQLLFAETLLVPDSNKKEEQNQFNRNI